MKARPRRGALGLTPLKAGGPDATGCQQGPLSSHSVCLGAVAMMGLKKGNANEDELLARSTEMPAVDCNIGDPFLHACFSPD